jgi:hypothetical protein
MIILKDDRLKVVGEKDSLYMSILFILNQETGLKLNPAKIDIYYGQLKEAVAITEVFNFFGVQVTLKDEGVLYKPKKNEKAIVNYFEENTGESQFVVGVGSIVCYNPLGKTLKGKPAEAIIIKVK